MAKKLSLMTMLAVLLSALLGLTAHATGPNTLSVHVEPAEGFRLPEAFALWQIPANSPDLDAVLGDLAFMNDAALNSAHPIRFTAAVDEHGTAVFSGLPDGRYYGRAANADGTSLTLLTAPFIIDLPQRTADGKTAREVTVRPKAVEEYEPSKPPAGGERFLKVDESNRPLPGASFVVMTKPDGERFERFLLAGRTVVVTSAADGRFEVTGLPFGRYYLMETVAPQGYRMLREPIAFTIDANSLDDGVAISIVNPKLPRRTVPKAGDLSLLLSLAAAAILTGMGTYFYRADRVKG
ncbi:MAG: prealbumin-like fold domain-containing protein [Propionibacteriaceae bacterium]|nr:prealbumin-like fold domain-containing protein [Propionibacteriaceae bacterium]